MTEVAHAGMTGEMACGDDYFNSCHPDQISRHPGPRAGLSFLPSYRKIQSIYPVSPKQSDSAEIAY